MFLLIYVTAKSKLAPLHIGVREAKVKLRSFSLPLHAIARWSLRDLAASWDRAEPQSGSGSYLEETYANVWTSRFSGGKDYIIQAETGLSKPNS
jgi:hypothetical protein